MWLVFEKLDDSLPRHSAKRWIPAAFNGHVLGVMFTKSLNSHPMPFDILGRNRILGSRKDSAILNGVDVLCTRTPHSTYKFGSSSSNTR
jgi:hypothetical protein